LKPGGPASSHCCCAAHSISEGLWQRSLTTIGPTPNLPDFY
jgi:hypothetical protein